MRAAKYLFAKGLDDIQWGPNPNGLQQRDIIGTNRGESGFWRRLNRHYGVNQFIIECKNFEEMGQQEFRQAWGYLGGPHGRLLMMVTRSEDEGLTERERSLVVEGYLSEPKKLVFLMPAKLLHLALRKMRSGKEKRDDYINDLLEKRLNAYKHSWVHLRAARASR